MTTRIPTRVSSRISQQVKRFQRTIKDAGHRDINESDTALIVAEMLAEVMGYKKLEEITTEYGIRGAYADLAVKIKNDLRFLVEVKAIGTELKETHVTQVVNYGANQGVDWAILTNAAQWQAYRITFSKPVDRVLVLSANLIEDDHKSDNVIEFFGNLSREVFTPSSMTEVFRAKQAMGKFAIAQIIMSDPVIGMVRRELRRLAPGLNPALDDIRDLIEQDVIKRELFDGDEAKAAVKLVRRATRKAARDRAANKSAHEPSKTNTSEPET